ncbi:MAG: biosynthetic arginine decarboxylase [Planctomycetota bacterium]|nr:biosynthetic arginine decarboxylase [Planctomycetota bacterium]
MAATEPTRIPDPNHQNESGQGPRVRSKEGSSWTREEAEDCYGLNRWGEGYFGVSDNGNLTLLPSPDSPAVELQGIVEGLRQRGLEMPVMLRIENLLVDRVRKLNVAFQKAIEEVGYRGNYRGVFPLKVNQQRHVVEQLVSCGRDFGHGLEVGSKAELLIAMSMLQSRDSLVICNGYKDREFVDLGLQLSQLGYNCFFVIENLSELNLILERSEFWDVRPLIGVRIKLFTRVEGHWQQNSGDRSLFGLTTVQLIELVDRLRQAQRLDCLQLLHFHLGSQVPDIGNIREGVNEACRYFIELVREGAELRFIDLGGGLAVDYDGSSSTCSHSRNYDLDEYCVDIVEALQESFDQAGIPHPAIVSESGRWTVAPMSILLFDVLNVDDFDSIGELDVIEMSDPSEPVVCLIDTLKGLGGSGGRSPRIQESYNDAIYYREQARREFRSGKISLREKAVAENICLKILGEIARRVDRMERPPLELQNLRDSLADIYYGNFSVFQSLPDAWAIEQVFPVMPIHRLLERPTRQGVIADLTCDCDGKLDRFAGKNGLARTLPLHALQQGEDYVLGVFLVGAYQETLGDLHNLFGDTNVASIRLSDTGQVEFLNEIHGDSISGVLRYVEYQPERIHEQFRELAEKAVNEGRISVTQRQAMLGLFLDSLRGFTYFEKDPETG